MIKKRRGSRRGRRGGGGGRRPFQRFAPKGPVARINEHISAKEVRVIGTDDEALGVMPIEKARELAQEKELDLIEVAPNAVPPVAKIMSYDKFRYQKEKEDKKMRDLRRKSETEMKSIRISARAAKNDLDFKAKKVNTFLEEGGRVEIQIMLRGREKGNRDWARLKVDNFLQSIETPFKIVSPLKFGGRGATMHIIKE